MTEKSPTSSKQEEDPRKIFDLGIAWNWEYDRDFVSLENTPREFSNGIYIGKIKKKISRSIDDMFHLNLRLICYAPASGQWFGLRLVTRPWCGF